VAIEVAIESECKKIAMAFSSLGNHGEPRVSAHSRLQLSRQRSLHKEDHIVKIRVLAANVEV
jgi:hypothetical protein